MLAAVVAVLAALFILLALLKPKPHAGKALLARLPGVRGKAGHKRFEAEREACWPAFVAEFGKSFEFDGLLATADPALVRAMLVQKPHNAQRSAIYKLMGKWLPFGDGILFMDGEVWSEHRRVAGPVFHATNFSRGTGATYRFTTELVDQWVAAGGTEDVLHDVRFVERSVLMHWGFGMDAASPLALELSQVLHDYAEWAFAHIPNDKRWRFPANYWHLRKLGARIHELSQRVVSSKAYEFTGEDNFVSAMVAAGLAPEVLSAEVNHIHGAHKAAALGIVFGIWELARHPEWVARLREEWASVLGEDRAHLEHADLPRLPLTDLVFKEVTRLHTVSLGVVRRTGEPLEVAGQTFPAGTEMILALHALHRDPELWERPDEFDPTRFERAPPRGAYFPFLDGTRRCAGMYHAELQFKLVLQVIFSRVDVHIVNDRLIKQANMFTTLESVLKARVTPVSS